MVEITNRKERMQFELHEVKSFHNKTLERLTKLEDFIHGSKFNTLNKEAKIKLIAQATTMKHVSCLLTDYYMVLNDRIEDVGDDDE